MYLVLARSIPLKTWMLSDRLQTAGFPYIMVTQEAPRHKRTLFVYSIHFHLPIAMSPPIAQLQSFFSTLHTYNVPNIHPEEGLSPEKSA